MKTHSPGFLHLVRTVQPGVRECTPAQVHDWLAAPQPPHGLHVLDVREDHEWAIDRIAGARMANAPGGGVRHLGRGILERDIEALIADLDAHIVLYCGGGFRSTLAAHNLQIMGYRNVWSMAGGISAWRAANLPIESSVALDKGAAAPKAVP